MQSFSKRARTWFFHSPRGGRCRLGFQAGFLVPGVSRRKLARALAYLEKAKAPNGVIFFVMMEVIVLKPPARVRIR